MEKVIKNKKISEGLKLAWQHGKRSRIMSEEQKKKLSISKKGKHFHTKEWLKNHSERMKGNKYSLGTKHTQER